MYAIKYILVNDSTAKGSALGSLHRFIPHIGHCIVCDAGSKFKVTGSSERQMLTEKLCDLRRHWPEAKILGVSELDVSASHAPVRVNPEMNALRRELSDLP